MTKKLISVIIPVYNEEGNIFSAYNSVREELEKRADVDFEIIFTDNHSTDKTFLFLQELSSADKRVKVLRFARNFGFNKSILTGYRNAIGDAAIQIDCDLEDPPSVFHKFIDRWLEGHDVVVGIRSNRAESKLMIWARKTFYRFLDAISETPHQVDAGDFRLVDRHILNQLIKIEDAQPYVRGLISELAKNQSAVVYKRGRREAGESKFPIRQLVRLGFEGIYAHSTIPLRLATYFGIFIAAITVAIMMFYVFGYFFFESSWPSGFTTTTVLLLFGISLNALFLGIIGEYVARIYQQVRQRPTVVIERSINL